MASQVGEPPAGGKNQSRKTTYKGRELAHTQKGGKHNRAYTSQNRRHSEGDFINLSH